MAALTIRAARPEDAPIAKEIVFASLRAYGIEPEPEGLDADVSHARGTAPRRSSPRRRVE
jgi:hypothetical protein